MKKLALFIPAVFVSSATFADVDVTAATSALTSDGGTAIAAVGAALIGLAGIAVVYKWIKGAIFG